MRLALIENDGWQLDNAEEIHNEHPDTFYLPPKVKRETIKPGDIVKLIFRSQLDSQEGNAVNVERMWVEVIERDKVFFKGRLDNDSYSNQTLRSGFVLYFLPKHVIEIYKES